MSYTHLVVDKASNDDGTHSIYNLDENGQPHEEVGEATTLELATQFAASPLLLEACKDALEVFKEYDSHYGVVSGISIKLHSAIKEAKQ